MPLPPDQLTALRNLAHKKGGGDVDWINIAAARALTELGLAERDHTGWKITAEGETALAAHSGDDLSDRPADVHAIPRR
jgi:hypothetical protein